MGEPGLNPIFNILIMIITDDTRYKPPRKTVKERYAEAWEQRAEASREMGDTLPLFKQGFWTCINGHDFDKGRIRSPSECPVCQARLVKWVPGPGVAELESTGGGTG